MHKPFKLIHWEELFEGIEFFVIGFNDLVSHFEIKGLNEHYFHALDWGHLVTTWFDEKFGDVRFKFYFFFQVEWSECWDQQVDQIVVDSFFFSSERSEDIENTVFKY